ncbi:MAG TPA: DUF6338 family protein, partial [Candidatus Thermoplasmatota archaeon]|nr:DUF6338 family protein [Candidatus Thermoplasmatota archaeon]
LILLAPGFLSLLVIQRASGRRAFRDTLEKTLASLILSAIADALFLTLHGLDGPSAALTKVLAEPVRSLLDLVLLAVWVAVFAALIVELDPISHLARLLYVKATYVPSSASTWEKFMQRQEANYVIVTTKKEERFLGVLWDYSFEEEERALTLANVQELDFADGDAKVLREFDRLHLRADAVEHVAAVQGGEVRITPGPVPWPSLLAALGFIAFSAGWFWHRWAH